MREDLMTEASLEQIMTAARHEHLVPGREVHVRDMRGHKFCEVGLITGPDQDNAIADIWNTTGVCDPTPEQVDALDADAVARENGAMQAWLDPVRQWAADEIDVWEAGEDRTFGDLTGTWMGAADAATMIQTAIQESYSPGYIYRNNTFKYRNGRQVYVLDAPDGESFVLQSFTRHWDQGLTEASLAHLGGRLDLPDGWGFRTEVLDRDLEISSSNENLAHVLHDNLHNVYQGSDVGRAFTGIVRQDSLW
jgi:haloalkane dehalogenase